MTTRRSVVTTYDEREDLREFHQDISRRRTEYLELGQEGTLCGRWGMLKACDNGHFLLSTLECGREWCPICGQDHSATHQRRISRLLPRVFAMQSVGYAVFEVPLVLRPYFLDVSVVREARRYIHRLLVRELHTRGVSRWHWQGEGGFNEFADTLSQPGKYHPHLNVLMDHGHIGKKQIRRIRRLWSHWVYRRCGRAYYKVSPFFYRYYKAPGKRYHLASYVTRPTFKHLTEDNIDFARALFSFNNQSWFGRFTKDDKVAGKDRYRAWVETLRPSTRRSLVEVQVHNQFNNNVCPLCHGEMRYMGVDRVEQHTAIRDFGGGLYQVKAPPWSWSYGRDDESDLHT
jgi:hypothetical protein